MSIALLQKWNSLNSVNQKQAFKYIEALLAHQQGEAHEQTPQTSNIQFGIWNHEKYYISDDFDEPLDDFKEYM